MSSKDGVKRHIACGCCRRRKLKCDGKRPSCSTCRRLNQVCEYPEIVRKAGPKRGYVRSLECRIAQLEKLLSDYCIEGSDKQLESADGLNIDEPMPPPELVLQLTELFFATFNTMIPVVDKQRYMAMLSQTLDRQPRPFLQYAIMATAAAVVPRFRRLKTILYSRARKYLHRAENLRKLNGAASVGFVQAICLIAHLECREGLLPQAWISVGKAHRALSMMLLAYIDGENYNDQVLIEKAEAAEMRRAFWFVFLCDRLGSLATTMNGTIELADIVTRMPMDDEAFLSGNYETDTCRIEDLLQEPALFSRFPNSRLAYLCTLSECIYQALQLGRFPRKRYMNQPKEWMAEYQKCETCLAALRTHTPVVPPVTPPPAEDSDPKELARYQEEKSRRISYILINVLAQAGMLVICRTGLYGIQAMPVLLPLMYPAKLLQQAMMAMLEILLITRNPHDLSVISAHPLHPISLFVVGVLLLALADYELVALQNFQAPLSYMIETLRELKDDMPLSVMLTSFLIPGAGSQKDDSVKCVEEVLVARRVNLALPNLFGKWAEAENDSDDGNGTDLDVGETSPSFGDENPPSVSSTHSPISSVYISSSIPPMSRAHPPAAQLPSLPRYERATTESPASIPSIDTTAGIGIKSEPLLNLDFASALELSQAFEEREFARTEVRLNPPKPGQTSAFKAPGPDTQKMKTRTGEPGRLDAKKPGDATPHFGQGFPPAFVGVETGTFDDPPDIFPESVDLSMDDHTFDHDYVHAEYGFEEDDRWFDRSPNSYQQVAWP